MMTSADHTTLCKDWFADKFTDLHPDLKQLHIEGGSLVGKVDVNFPAGIAGWLGRRIARKLGIPAVSGEYPLTVTISHDKDGLHWDRCFDKGHTFKSLFIPVGQWPTGYWLEKSGPIQLKLTVDVIDGGWYWRTLAIRYRGIALPKWLFPASTAYKKIENQRYRFYVGFTFPVLGEILSYSGLLEYKKQP